MEKKKKNSKWKVWKVVKRVGSFLVIATATGYVLYRVGKSKYEKLNETKDVGNFLKSDEMIELENGSKEFVSTIDGVGFLNRGDTDGVWIDADNMKIDPYNLESITGNPNFRIRPGQEMKYLCKAKLGYIKAFLQGAKSIIGYFPLVGKEI